MREKQGPGVPGVLGVLECRRFGTSETFSGSSAESVGRFRLRELTQRMVQGDF